MACIWHRQIIYTFKGLWLTLLRMMLLLLVDNFQLAFLSCSSRKSKPIGYTILEVKHANWHQISQFLEVKQLKSWSSKRPMLAALATLHHTWPVCVTPAPLSILFFFSFALSSFFFFSFFPSTTHHIGMVNYTNLNHIKKCKLGGQIKLSWSV